MAFSTVSRAYDLMDENKFLASLSRSTSLSSSISNSKLALTQWLARELEHENEKMSCLHEDLKAETSQIKEIICRIQKTFKNSEKNKELAQ